MSPDPDDVVAASPPMPTITLGRPNPPSLVTTRAPDAPQEEPLEPVVEDPPAPDLEALLAQVLIAVGNEPGQPAAAMDWARQHLADAVAWVQEHRRRHAGGEDPFPPDPAPEAPPAPARSRKN